MNKDNFIDVLLENKIIDSRKIYSIVVKKTLVLFPSFKIMVMGLYKDEIVFYHISTNYRIKSYIESFDIKNIKMFDIEKTRKDFLINFYFDRKLKRYIVLENQKEIYELKKIIKK